MAVVKNTDWNDYKLAVEGAKEDANPRAKAAFSLLCEHIRMIVARFGPQKSSPLYAMLYGRKPLDLPGFLPWKRMMGSVQLREFVNVNSALLNGYSIVDPGRRRTVTQPSVVESKRVAQADGAARDASVPAVGEEKGASHKATTRAGQVAMEKTESTAPFVDAPSVSFSRPPDPVPGLDAMPSENIPDATAVMALAEGVNPDPSLSGSGEKKRRSRPRRSRGRKKAATAAVSVDGQNSADAPVSAGVREVTSEESPSLTGDDAGRLKGAPPEEKEEKTAVDDPGKYGNKSADSALDGAESGIGEEKNVPAIVGRRKMFVSVVPGEQVEVVITEEGQVQEYYVEMLHQAKIKNNIYKGIIHNVDSNLQAAFVNYGAGKNGFLQIDEVHPEYYMAPHEPVRGRTYPPIQKVLKPGQEVLVQVVKEPSGTKGAFLTTYLSLAGRFLVLTPGREQIGVSRKVENEKERARLREMLEGLNPGMGIGVIVRTVSMGASKTNLQRDLQYLKRVWKDVRTRGTTEKAPCQVYQEIDLTARAARDYLNESIGEVWIDDGPTAASVADLAVTLFPRKKNLVRVHDDSNAPLFERFNLQRQLEQIHSREVALPSGGRLIIDATEALTAIDINSGRSGGKNNFEDMAFRTNMEAAKMIPLHLRLRDIGGQVVADFIEMRDKAHWREVEKMLRNGMKNDRARYDVGKIGPFGMLEMVRQRIGSSAISVSSEPCPCCKGTGMRRNMEWQSQDTLRGILRALRVAQKQGKQSISHAVEQELALHLLNHKRQRLFEMESAYGVHVDIEIIKHE